MQKREELSEGIVTQQWAWCPVDIPMQAHIRSLPVEQVGQHIHDRFKDFHEQGKLLEPSRPAHLVANLLQGESTGEIVSIYD